MNVDPAQLYREIQHNLGILETTLDGGRVPDLGFIEIFANDIDVLRQKNFEPEKATLKLSYRLEKVANRIFNAASSTSTLKDVVVPYLGKEKSLNEVADGYTAGDVKKGLMQLDSNYAMRRIKGDGHCLFRAMGVGLLLRMKESKEVEGRIEVLLEESSEFPKIAQLKEALKGFRENKLSLEDVMGEQKKSNLIVEFLRWAACEKNERDGGESFEQVAKDLVGSKERYLSDMKGMKKADVGGQPEIIAIARSLGLRLHVLDVRAIGKGLDVKDPHSFYGPEGGAEVALLYRPGHYDLAEKK